MATGGRRATIGAVIVALLVAAATEIAPAAVAKKWHRLASRVHRGRLHRGGQRSWAAATRFRRPAFHPRRRITVHSPSAFWSAWNALRPGDEIDVRGVVFSGESVFRKQLPGWAEVHFGPGTRFVGTPGPNLPAVWIDAARHVRFYGGTVTNPKGGAGILVHDSAYVSWWNFVVHDTGNSGLMVQGIHTTDTRLDFKGEISRWGENLRLDPHAEKGTGLHGALLADANYGVRNSRFALDLHDGASGAGLTAGGSKSSDGFWHNTLYVECRHLTKRATIQVAGNCVEVWGENVIGNRFEYIQAQNLQGRPFDATGMYGGQSLASDVVEYGRASHTNLNPRVGRVRWDRRHGPAVFQNVSPRH